MMNPNHFEQKLKQRLADYDARTFASTSAQAGVLVPLILKPEPALLLTVRAAHLKSHPGQVSFPGGMAEPVDADIVQTALRETHEEVGIAPRCFQTMGMLSTTLSKDGVQVFPVVATLAEMVEYSASADETAEVFTVPWAFFKENEPVFERVERHGVAFEIPHFDFQGKDIWGLTAMVILELMNVIEGSQWSLPQFGR